MIALVFLDYSSWIFVYSGELNAAIARVREAKARFGPAVRAALAPLELQYVVV